MTYAFLFLIVGFAVLSSLFLWLNDFSSDTVEILFPAAGAVLASFFLGYKAIWLDAPATKEQQITVGLLHDKVHGKVYSMYRPAVVDTDSDYRDFRGFTVLEHVQSQNALMALELEGQLKAEPDEELYDLLAEIVEFALLQWLASNHDLQVGYEGSYSVMISGGGGGGGSSQELVPASFDTTERENPLVAAAGLKVSLPRGSHVQFGERAGHLSIRTAHSLLSFRLNGVTWESFAQSVSGLSKLIKQRYGLPTDIETPNFGVFGLSFTISSRQVAFTRLSKQAEVERRWLDYVQQRLFTEFAFERLREYFLGPRR